jgi:phage FluMu protein gp41
MASAASAVSVSNSGEYRFIISSPGSSPGSVECPLSVKKISFLFRADRKSQKDRQKTDRKIEKKQIDRWRKDRQNGRKTGTGR